MTTADSRQPTPVDPVASEFALRQFGDALPSHLRAGVIPHLDPRVLLAIGLLEREKADLADVARTCGAGTEGRSTGERRRIAMFRLFRAAETLGAMPDGVRR